MRGCGARRRYSTGTSGPALKGPLCMTACGSRPTGRLETQNQLFRQYCCERHHLGCDSHVHVAACQREEPVCCELGGLCRCVPVAGHRMCRHEIGPGVIEFGFCVGRLAQNQAHARVSYSEAHCDPIQVHVIHHVQGHFDCEAGQANWQAHSKQLRVLNIKLGWWSPLCFCRSALVVLSSCSKSVWAIAAGVMRGGGLFRARWPLMEVA